MALFESASKQLVKDTGRLSLRPVVDLNSTSKYRLMNVVEKKKSRWFWRSTKYLPTPFTLNEIMTDQVDVTSKIETKEFVSNYSNEPTLHVSGKLGGKLATELGIDVSTADSFVVKIDLGKINKSEIRWQDLNDALKDKRINLDHKFVDKVLGSERRSICVVHETIKTTKDTNIQSDLQVEGAADVNESATTNISVKVEGSVKDTHHRSFDIPNDTTLGYGCYGLHIMGDTIELEVDKKLVAPVHATDGANNVDAASPFGDEIDGQDSALKSTFDPLLKSPKKDDILKSFREIMAIPDSIKPLADLLEDAIHSIERKKVPPHSIEKFKCSVGAWKGWEEFLTLVGFNFDKEKGVIVYPDEDAKDLVYPCSGFVETLTDLSSAQCLALKDVTPEYVDPLLYLIRNAMYGRNTPADDPQLKRIYSHTANPGKSFLLALGFVHIKEKGKNVLDLPVEPFTPLGDAYVAVYVMGCN